MKEVHYLQWLGKSQVENLNIAFNHFLWGSQCLMHGQDIGRHLLNIPSGCFCGHCGSEAGFAPGGPVHVPALSLLQGLHLWERERDCCIPP